ncbi:MAG: ubiquitin-like domain-containing protein [Sporichthyaceae bacterium]
MRVRGMALQRPPGSAKKWAVHALVVAAMVGGVSAFVSFDKTVELTVDGRTEKVHTFARSVAGVLAREGITVGDYDSVVPALDRKIEEGQRIAVRFGRPIELDLDGNQKKVWVLATSVDEALDELGVRDRNVYVSASRSERIGREGLTLRVLSPREVTLIADGKTRKLKTSAGSVRQLLVEAGIVLDALDEVNPQLDAAPEDGAKIRVVRVDTKRIVVKVDIPFKVKKIDDPKMFPWERKVVTKGKKGLKETVVELVKRDGKVADKDTVSSRVIREPRTEVVRVGTKAAKFARTGAEALNWAALAKCESGGNPRAVNPLGYYGLYQFSPGTWRTVGGRGLPHKASASEQTYRAMVLYKREGARPWPVCGRKLFS